MPHQPNVTKNLYHPQKRERLDPHGVVIFDGSVKPRFCREAPQCQGAIVWHYQAKAPSGYAPQCRSAITKGTTKLCQSAITRVQFLPTFPGYIYDLSIYITPIAILLLFPYHATNITGGNIKAGKKAAQGIPVTRVSNGYGEMQV